MNVYFRLKTHSFNVSRQKGFYFPLETDRAFLTLNFCSFTREYKLRELILYTRFPSNQDLLDLHRGYWESFFPYPHLYKASHFFSFLFVTHLAYHATNGLISTTSLSHAILLPFLSNLPFNLTTLIWQFVKFARKGLINSSWCAKYCHLRFRILFFNQRKTPQKLWQNCFSVVPATVFHSQRLTKSNN